MKKLITILAALAVTVSFATAADAAKKEAKKAGAGNPEERFKKLDTNGDGFISLDEIKASPQGQKDAAKAETAFKAKDKDGDGKLSPEEFAAGGGKKGGDAAKPGDAKKPEAAAPKADGAK
jgi:Skp family chaperone for outer membrane proteins